MINPVAMEGIGVALSDVADLGAAKERIELYSNEDLTKTYETCRDYFEGDVRKCLGNMPGFRPSDDLFEGAAALDILRERHGRFYTENLTGIAETGFKGFFNRWFETSLKPSKPPHPFYLLPREEEGK